MMRPWASVDLQPQLRPQPPRISSRKGSHSCMLGIKHMGFLRVSIFERTKFSVWKSTRSDGSNCDWEISPLAQPELADIFLKHFCLQAQAQTVRKA